MRSMPWLDADLGIDSVSGTRREPFMFLHALHGESSVFVFARTIGLAIVYDDSGLIIWKNISVVESL